MSTPDKPEPVDLEPRGCPTPGACSAITALRERDALRAEVERLRGLVRAAFEEGHNGGLSDGHPINRVEAHTWEKSWVKQDLEAPDEA